MDHSWVIFIDFEVITGYDTLKDIRVSADFNDATGRPLQTVILVVLDPKHFPGGVSSNYCFHHLLMLIFN